MRWALFLFLLLGGPVHAQGANPDALSLQLGGYPLLDPDRLLSPLTRAQLEQRQEALAACCALDLVILVQGRSRNGSAEADLETLRAQIVRAGLWTPQTLLILHQSRPGAVVIARGQEATEQTTSLTPQTLAALAQDPIGSASLVPFLANLENQERARLTAAQVPRLSPEQRDAIIFVGFTAALGFAGMILIFGYRRRAGLALAATHLDALPSQPLIGFPFPAKALKTSQVLGGPGHVLIVKPRQGTRHRGFILWLAIGVTLGLGLGFGQGFAPFGLDLPLGLSPYLVGLFSGILVFVLLLITPMGAWLTPPLWRHRALRTQLLAKARRHGRPCLILVHQRGILHIWQPASLPIRPALLLAPAQRLAGEAAHGAADHGFTTFVDQVTRLARTYVRKG